MNSLMIALTLLLTIATAMALGIALGYGAITAILQVMGHRPQPEPAPALVTAAHAGE